MGLWPTQADEKLAPVQQLLSLEAPRFPLSSRPERSAVEGPAVFLSVPARPLEG
jgi:hypothetical protein